MENFYFIIIFFLLSFIAYHREKGIWIQIDRSHRNAKRYEVLAEKGGTLCANKMKVKYGTSIPPLLTSPTRGELRLRVEKLILHPELVAGIPIDNCSVGVAWWGGEDAPPIECTPPTQNAVNEGTTILVFPIKTLAGQLQQYFEHMTAAIGGVQLPVAVPTSFSGKKKPIPVGVAAIRLEALTPGTPISGWLNIVDAQTKTQCIGRIKFHVSVNFFESSGSSATAASPKTNQPSPKKEEEEGEKVNQAAAPPDAKQVPLNTIPGAASIPTGAEAATVSHPPVPSVAAATVLTQPQRALDDVETSRLRSVIQKAIELRERMTREAQSTSVPVALHMDAIETSKQAAVYPIPSLHDEDPHPAADQSADSSEVSSTTSGDASTESDEDQRYRDHLHAAEPPIREYNEADKVSIRLADISFSRAIHSGLIQFRVRTSRDVTFAVRSADSIRSAALPVPVLRPVVISFVAERRTSKSCAVIEAVELSGHDFEVNTLLGIFMIGIFEQQGRHIEFHDPISGDNPVSATVSLALTQLAQGERRTERCDCEVQTLEVEQPTKAAAPSRLPANGIFPVMAAPSQRQLPPGPRDGAAHLVDSPKASAPSEAVPMHQPEATNGRSASQGVASQGVALSVSIEKVKHVPCVASAESPHSNGVAPNTFVTLDEVRDGHSTPLDGWECTPSDMSQVVRACQNPVFNFAATVFLPPTVRLVADVNALVIKLWHQADESFCTDSSNHMNSEEGGEQEDAFWRSAHVLGSCVVDLKCLRYVKGGLVDGWCHVHPPNLEDMTIGQAKVVVKLLQDAPLPV